MARSKSVGVNPKQGPLKPSRTFTGRRISKSTPIVKEKTEVYDSSRAPNVKVPVRVISPAEREVTQIIIFTNRPEFELTPIQKMQMVEEGISKKALEKLKDKSGLDYDQLSRLLNVSRTTLIGTKGNTKFNTDISDKILGLADIYSYGYEVFEDRDRFNEWIFKPNNALGGQSPFELLHNSFGKEEVKNLIGRIDYGIYS